MKYLLFFIIFTCSFVSAKQENIEFMLQINAVQNKNELNDIIAVVTAFSFPDTLSVTETMEKSMRIIEITSLLPTLSALEKIRNSLPEIYEEINCSTTLKVRTASLSGSLSTYLSFKVLPGSKLFYMLDQTHEFSVSPDKIDAYGNVSLNINIPRKKPDFIYARSIKGKSERFIKINLTTGKWQEIPPEQYPLEKNRRIN